MVRYIVDVRQGAIAVCDTEHKEYVDYFGEPNDEWLCEERPYVVKYINGFKGENGLWLNSRKVMVEMENLCEKLNRK